MSVCSLSCKMCLRVDLVVMVGGSQQVGGAVEQQVGLCVHHLPLHHLPSLPLHLRSGI